MDKHTSQEEQFTDYLERYKKLIVKIARAYCVDPEERKDLIQDITIQLWRSFPKYNPALPISTWTYRIAINVSISHLRKVTSREKNLHSYREEMEIMSVDDSSTDENLKQLYLFIERLKPIDKAIMILTLEGCQNKEIAEVMGLSISNVSTKKLRIKKELKHYFESSKPLEK